MLLSKLLGERYKEKPAEAVLSSHIYLLRGGYIRQVASGIFTLLPPAQRIIRKIEEIVREEMAGIDGQEVLFPVVLPAQLWQESGRYASVGSELLKFKDRNNHDLVLGMTHEEAAVHLARSEAKSYLKYPFMIYQIQTKFCDEPRARGGLIRVREFTMKDAYSFHTSQKDLEVYYEKVLEAYKRIFARVGFKNVKVIKSDTGMMGGQVAHEFMCLSEGGEDTIVLCDNCGYQANMEVAVSKPIKNITEKEQVFEEVYTPGIKDIKSLAEYLNILPQQTIKAAVFIRSDNDKPVVVFIRGDLEVNENKVAKILQTEIFPLNDYTKSDLCFGFIGPYPNLGDLDVLFDTSLVGESNMVGGANRKDYHIRGINVDRDLNVTKFNDMAKVNDGDSCNICGKALRLAKGIEIGNIFQLGNKYTQAMNMTYLDQNGHLQTPLMGCYGIGIGRLLACIIEDNHDEYGPIWPKSVTPWQIHICLLNNNIEEIHKVGFKLYENLSSSYEVILDDRAVSAGFQFSEADLIGVPIRIIVSKRNLENGEVEVVTRDKSVKSLVKLTEVEDYIRELRW